MASPNHLLANEELVEQMDIKVNITHYPNVTLLRFAANSVPFQCCRHSLKAYMLMKARAIIDQVVDEITN